MHCFNYEWTLQNEWIKKTSKTHKISLVTFENGQHIEFSFTALLQCNGHAQDVHEFHMEREPGLVKGRFNMGTIFLRWLISKFVFNNKYLFSLG